jgi:cell division protein FtsL
MEMTRASTAFDYNRYSGRDTYMENKAAIKSDTRSRSIPRVVLLLFVSLFVAAICIALLYVKAQVYMAQREANSIQSQINDAERLNSTLSEELSEAMNVNTIMEKAEKLGMSYPTGDQILYVSMGENPASIEMKNSN